MFDTLSNCSVGQNLKLYKPMFESAEKSTKKLSLQKIKEVATHYLWT